MNIDQAIGCLDFIWQEERIIDRLVNLCLIQEELEKNPIDVSDDELQDAMDAFRRGRRLYSADETVRWMERQGISHEKLERLVHDEVVVKKLRDAITSARVDEYLEQHRADFDRVCIARIEYPNEARAREAMSRLGQRPEDFYDAAIEQVAGAGGNRDVSCHLISVVRRGTLGADLKGMLFSSALGDVVGPVRDQDSYALLRVLSFIPARADETTRRAIQEVLFQEWLDERRQRATIEWLWGDAARTREFERKSAGAPRSRGCAPSGEAAVSAAGIR
jgi:putative peptide maturation system protein